MKDLRFEVGRIGGKDVAEQFSENLTFDQKEMARAATAAFRAGGNLAKTRGRTNIAAAGFSTKWQNALRVNVYPPGKDSLRPAIYMYHKIPYAGVFEDSETIKGSPTLWIPVPGLVQRFGKRNERLTPQSFERATGQDLVPFRDPHTGTLVLGVRIRVPKKGATKLTLARLQRGEGGKQGVLSTVPVFVGVKQATIPRKFGLTEVMEGLAGELPGLYLRNLE